MKTLKLILTLLTFSISAYSQGSAEIGGIGVRLTNLYDLAVGVESVVENSPAERAGIKAGDWIDAVDGVSCLFKSPEEVTQMIRGEIGTMVEIAISRGKEEMTLNIKRESLGLAKQEPDEPVIEKEEETAGEFCSQFDKLLLSAVNAWEGVRGERVEGGIFYTYFKSDFDLTGFTDLRIGSADNFSATYATASDSVSGIAKYQELIDKINNCQLGCMYAADHVQKSKFMKDYMYIPFMLNTSAESGLMKIQFRVLYVLNPVSGQATVSINVWKEK